MMKKCRYILVLLSAYILSACVTPVVAPSNEYLLTDKHLRNIETEQTKEESIQIMPIFVANYLAGNEIVLVTQEGEVHRSKSHLWAESLSSQLTRLTQQRLEKTLPNVTWFGGQRLPAESISVLNIDVDDFYADLEGTIHISGRWQLLSELGELSASNTFYVSDKLKSDGYSTMVQTLSASWFNQVVNPISKDIVKALHN